MQENINTAEFIIEKEHEGCRIDKWLSIQFERASRSQLQKWIGGGRVLLNKKATSNNARLHVGDSVSVQTLEEAAWKLVPEDIPLDIIYEDESVLVVNKPKHMVVHPAVGNENRTLVNALEFHCNGQLADCNGEFRKGIVHRIDKDTSGLLVVAKDNNAYEILSEQVSAHTMDRYYEAVVYGVMKEENGTIAEPIGRSNRDRKKMAISYENGAKNAVTQFAVVERFRNFTHIICKLETGRTHQIRVHMASIGHPVAGDVVYGPQKDPIKRLEGQCLHARALGFTHPVTGERMYFETELPKYFTDFLKILPKA